MKKTYITKSFEETQKLGYDIAKSLNGKNILALYGNLGSGKTTFTQGLAKGLGIKKGIISPTFIIVRQYEIPPNSSISNFKSFYHIDLYRIENKKELNELGLNEIINDSENVVIIEWPEKIDQLLPNTRRDLYFEYMNSDERKIIIEDL